MKKLKNIIIIKANLELESGLHIGTGDTEMHIGGTDSQVIKNPFGNPYIPGSSIKGKIRSLLELFAASECKPIIQALFGFKAGQEFIENIGSPRLTFRDCQLNKERKKQFIEKDIPLTESKMENSIDRKTSMATPRSIERVNAGNVFDFELALKILENDNEEDLREIILLGLKLLELDYLGGSGSRGYGKVKFTNISIGKEKFDNLDNVNPFDESKSDNYKSLFDTNFD